MTSTTSGAPPQRAKEAATTAATEVASTAKEQASNVASTSAQQAQEVARDAAAHAKDVLGQSRDQLRGHADEQARAFGGTLEQLGTQLQGMLRGEAPPPGPVSDIAHQLASGASQFGSRLSNEGIGGAFDDIKRFARRRPGLFLVTALGAGVVVGRMLRASDTHALMDAVKPSGGSDEGSGQFGEMALPAGDTGLTGLGMAGSAADMELATAMPAPLDVAPSGATVPPPTGPGDVDLRSPGV